MITSINEWRKINESHNDYNVGDLVYVSPFGPATLAYSDNGGTISRDKPFRPKLYNFTEDTQYEILDITNNFAGFFDDKNEYVEISLSNISKTPMNNGVKIDESNQTAKNSWWDKNFKALIDYASNLSHDEWHTMLAKDIKDADDLEDTLGAIMDETGKHKALNLLNKFSIAELNDMIGKKSIKEDVEIDAKQYNIDIKPSEFDGKPINVWTVNAANDMKFGNWESAMNWLIDLWNSDNDLYYFFRGELSTSDEVVIGDQIFAGADVQDHMKLVSESIINEGHDGEIGPLNNAKTKEEAEAIVRKWIRTDKEEEDGDYRKFRDVKWLGKTTEDKMDKESMKWEDQYVILGEVDGEIWMARSSRS
jgi:hypothetical protein